MARKKPPQERTAGIAAAVAAGVPGPQIEASYDLPAGQLAELKKDPRFQRRVERLKETQRTIFEGQQAAINLLLPKAFRSLDRILDDPEHRENGVTARWLVTESLMKQRQTVNEKIDGVRFEISGEGVPVIADMVKGLLEHHRKQPPVVSIDQDPNLIQPGS